MIVFLYRPSPQVPKPSAFAARQCVEASLFNIGMQREQIATSSVDLTWIFTQSLFMSLNAILWALSYPEIRQEYSKETMKDHIVVAQRAIYLASERWPGVESALELYQPLIAACLKAYDGNNEISYVVESSSSKASPASLQDPLTPPPLLSPFTSPQFGNLQAPHPSPGSYYPPGISPTLSQYSVSDPGVATEIQNHGMPSMPRQSSFDYMTPYHGASFNPDSVFNAFPQVYQALQPWQTVTTNNTQYLGSLGEQYSQYLHAPYTPQQPLQTLNREEQLELMKNLENTPIDWG